MSKSEFKFLLRFNLPGVNTASDMTVVLKQMDIKYKSYDNRNNETKFISEVEHEKWDTTSSITSNQIYLDYVLFEGDNVMKFDKSISLPEINDVKNQIPVEYQPKNGDICVVASGHYDGINKTKVLSDE